MEQIYYPILGIEKNLPVYVTCIGENEWQCPIIRKEGYYETQIIFCTDGKGRLLIDNEEHIITKGMCMFLPSGYPHVYEPLDKVWTTHWVAFDG